MKKQLLVSLIFLFFASGYVAFSKTVHSADFRSSFSTKQNPLVFIQNVGQIKDQFGVIRNDIDFKLGTDNGLQIFIGKGQIHYQFTKQPLSKSILPKSFLKELPTSEPVTSYRLDVCLLGSNSQAIIITSEPQTFYEQYLGLKDNNSIDKALSFSKIVYKNIYQGIDWVLYVKDGKLKHEFIVHENGNPDNIQIQYSGSKELFIDNNGCLIATTPLGKIIEAAPITFNSAHKIIPSGFINEGSLVKYFVAKKNIEMTIDPTICWATYVGGYGDDILAGICVDNEGNVYVTGRTSSGSNIATSGAYNVSYNGGDDALLVKFDKNGNRIWGTYFGGNYHDNSSNIICDNHGFLYVFGNTSSYSGIATTGAYQTTLGGGDGAYYGDVYLAKFDASTGYRIWGTYYGGSGYDCTQDFAMDSFENLYLTGYTTSYSEFGSSGSYQPTNAGGWDAYFAKFDSSGNRIWGTYFGGTSNDYGTGLILDLNNKINVVGDANSVSGIATPNSYQPNKAGGTDDGFIAQFDNNGALVWSTYYGGTGNDVLTGIRTDVNNNLYAIGQTTSTNDIATSGSYQTTLAGSTDAFAVKFSNTGSRIWGSYFGGTGQEMYTYIDKKLTDDHFYITGTTNSNTNIATSGAFKTNINANDVFVAKMKTNSEVIWSSYFGGNNVELPLSITRDNFDNVYISGYTTSSSNLATPNAHQTSFGGTNDGFLTKINYADAGRDTTICASTNYVLGYSAQPNHYYSWTSNQGNVIANVANPTVSPLVNTAYYLKDSVAIDEFGFDTVFVTVTPLPTNIIAADTLIGGCTDSLLVVANTAYNSYTWNTGETTNSIYAHYSGWYFITATNNLGCIGNDSVFVSLVNAKILQNDTSICEGNTLTLNVQFPSNLGTSYGNSLPPSLQNGLVAYYPFSGNANDVSSNINNGTVHGASLTTDRFNNSNAAYSFNSSSYNAIIPDSLNKSMQNTFAYSFWVMPTASTTIIPEGQSGNEGHPSTQTVIPPIHGSNFGNYSTTVGAGIYVGINGVVLVEHSHNWVSVPLSHAMNLMGWHMITVNYNNKVPSLYIDGNYIKTGISSGMDVFGSLGPDANSFSNYIASGFGYSRWNFGDVGFDGKIDELIYYNRTLTPAEINMLYLQTQQPVSFVWSTGDTTQNIVVTPIQTTTYYCTISDGISSCTDSVTVVVNQLPTVEAGNNLSICSGTSIQLNAVSNAAVTWNNNVVNNQSFVPTSTKSYTVTALDVNGCTNKDSLTVTVNPSSSYTFYVSVCDSYYWDKTDSTYTQSGIYTYVENCHTDSLNLTITPATSTYTTVTACGSYNWNGMTYTSSGLYSKYPGGIQALDGSNKYYRYATYYDWDCMLFSNGIYEGQPFPVDGHYKIEYDSNGIGTVIESTGGFANIFVVGTPFNNSWGTSNNPTWSNMNFGQSFCNGINAHMIYVQLSGPINSCHTDYLDLSIIPITTDTTWMNTCSAYTWSIDGQTYSQSGTYLNIVGCHTNVLVLNIFQNGNMPTEIIASGPLTICPSGNVILTANSANSYLWSNGATTQSITVNSAGTFTVIANYGLNCNGISNPVSVLVKSIPTQVKIKTTTPTVVCEPNKVSFVIDLPFGTTTGFNHQWNLNGNPIAGANDTIIQANASGAYSLTINSGGNCIKTSAAKNATIKPLPTANFTANGSTSFCLGSSVTLSAPAITGYTYTWLRDGVTYGGGNSKVIKLAGNYLLVAKLNGCMDTTDFPVPITVNPLPVASISSISPLMFCAGDSVLLYANPIGNNFAYKWMNGTSIAATTNSPELSVFNTGTYKVVVTDNNGCVSKTSTSSVKTKMNLIPIVTITALSSTTISLTGNVKLVAAPGTGVTWQWYKDGNPLANATTKNYTAFSGGVYTVFVTKLGCVGTSSITVTQTVVKTVEGIIDSESDFSIIAYPNPVTDVLTIKAYGIEMNSLNKVEVINSLGQTIAIKEFSTTKCQLSTDSWASGIYFIRYKNVSGNSALIKIVKE